MSESKKPIYKIKFEVEVEITKEVLKNRRGVEKYGYSPKMHIKKDLLINDFDANKHADKNVSDTCSHIEEHFPDRIRLIYGDMFHNEGFIINTDLLDIKSKSRERVIAETARMENQMQRGRLQTRKGRNPDKSKRAYLADKEQFINKCIEIMKAIQNDGDRVTQLKLANMYFTDAHREKQVKPLFAKLKLYEISWKELVAKIPNNVK